jgi:drug/metabolite transporter superfamily protein YnfA
MAALPPEHPDFQRWADPVASTGAMLCAIHCAALPFLLAALPSLSLGFFSSAGFELSFALFATLVGISSLWSGYRRHRAGRPYALLLPGLASVWIGVLATPVHDNVVAHAVFMSIGGTFIAVAHLLNLRLSRLQAHGPGCAHSH